MFRDFLLKVFRPWLLGQWLQPESTASNGGRSHLIQWGNIQLSEADCTSHFLAIGTTGSGKTTFFRLLEQSVFRNIGTGDYRALVYDAKGETLARIISQVDATRIFIMNPFDQRGAAWDIAKDLDEPIKIKEFCFTLMPLRSDSQPFWAEAARELMNGVILSFFLSGLDYTLGDVLRTLRHFGLMRRVLRLHPQTKHLVEVYLKDKRLRRNLMATIGSRVQIYEPVAACWEMAEQKISMKDFVRSDWVLLLGNVKVSPQVMQAINCAMFKTISNEALILPDSTTRRTWVFLDELTEAGRLDGLISLAKEGRSKGICLVLGFQTISGMRDEKLYGTHGTDDLLGEIGIRFIGRLECTSTAEYASQHIGDHLVWETSFGSSRTYSKENSRSDSVNHAQQQRRKVLPSEFLNLPKCNPRNGLHGFCNVPSIGLYRLEIPGEKLFRSMLIPPDKSVVAFISRPAESQLLDYSPHIVAERLGIDLPSPLKTQTLDFVANDMVSRGVPFDPNIDPTSSSDPNVTFIRDQDDERPFVSDPLA